MEDRDRLGPRLYRRGLHGQPKIIVKTKLGTQDVAQFTVDNITQCLKDNGYGELPEDLGQEALMCGPRREAETVKRQVPRVR